MKFATLSKFAGKGGREGLKTTQKPSVGIADDPSKILT
jgi:hypothetical protein